MFKLIKNVEVYNPLYLGINDILICNDKIIKIAKNIDYPDAIIIDKSGMIAIPGIIDQHVHVIGGGGEGGFHTRTPEVKLSDLIKGGVTTVVGLLGTDSITRNIEDLVAKTKALKNEGLTAYCLTGAYTYPSPTLTGSVSKDITFIDEIIGLKIALSDHRESLITKEQLAQLVASVRVSSMISNKAGIVTIHMGDDKNKLAKIFEIINETSLPIYHFRPTHVNRNDDLFLDSLLFLEKGGYIDLTVGNKHETLIKNLNTIIEKKLSLEKVTFSSDGNGSFSNYDENGILIKIGVSSCDGILNTMKFLIENNFSIIDTIRFASTNVANGLSLGYKKGYLQENYDADILIVDQKFNLDTVITLGKIMMQDQKILIKGTFEE